jgi:hypothetical protein
MTEKDKALKSAIQAIEILLKSFCFGDDWKGTVHYDVAVRAMYDCKQALKQKG